MDIERLKELKSWVSDLRKFGVSEGNETIELIDEAIARQSVKSEEVAEAISWAQGMEILYEEKQMPECADRAKTAIAALQEYQPWIPVGERLPEEYRFVLISIFNGKATGVGMIDKNKRWYGIDHQEMEVMPEAWKPLPEPLKGERVMDNAGKIDLKEQLKSLFDTGINLSMVRSGLYSGQ